ncbi:hypothetical protein FNV43_RR11056 [Rhamnella rubrinervis]|uniref:Uncharacterized protein n=1 Tax=Rhamnella rubrinervis TaxID=2594499 RepID=A0A8K0MGW6_9ROSA|nr:hypothetical protein FNV43_RR11056 [Rhamnella rubrinervis]
MIGSYNSLQAGDDPNLYTLTTTGDCDVQDFCIKFEGFGSTLVQLIPLHSIAVSTVVCLDFLFVCALCLDVGIIEDSRLISSLDILLRMLRSQLVIRDPLIRPTKVGFELTEAHSGLVCRIRAQYNSRQCVSMELQLGAKRVPSRIYLSHGFRGPSSEGVSTLFTRFQIEEVEKYGHVNVHAILLIEDNMSKEIVLTVQHKLLWHEIKVVQHHIDEVVERESELHFKGYFIEANPSFTNGICLFIRPISKELGLAWEFIPLPRNDILFCWKMEGCQF